MSSVRGFLSTALCMVLLCVPSAAAADHSVLRLVTTGDANSPCQGPVVSNPLQCRMGGIDVSADGGRVVFFTQDPLVPGDTDDRVDLYLRADGVTTRLSDGPKGPLFNFDVPPRALMSEDGARVVFGTEYSLLAEDADIATDIYLWTANGGLDLLTPGTASQAALAGISKDGRHVLFESGEALDPLDTDVGPRRRDLYEAVDGALRLVSTGPADTGLADDETTMADFEEVSDGGQRVFFSTPERLVPEDGDLERDVYERSGGRTILISTGPQDAPAPGSVSYRTEGPLQGGAVETSADGSRVFFATSQPLVPEDLDGTKCMEDAEDDSPCSDVYERSGGTTRLVSRDAGCACDAQLRFATPDGVVFFQTAERLVPEDQNDLRDLYQDRDGVITLVTAGEDGRAGGFRFQAATSEDGSHVFFESAARLSPDDSDDRPDIFERFDGYSRLVTTGPLGDPLCSCELVLWGVSADGARAFYGTRERLVPDDPESRSGDLYERHNGVTTLISQHAAQPPSTLDALDNPSEVAISSQGTHVFFLDHRRLLPDDVDDRRDIYEAVVASPPDCTGALAERPVLGAGKHSFARLSIAGVVDPDGDSIAIDVDTVTQDEPVRGKGDNTSPDARRTAGTVELRAERNPKGDGRMYRVAFTASDGNGGSCTGTVTVGVPRHKGRAAVDSAPPVHDSFGG